jgi:hypothetical protein
LSRKHAISEEFCSETGGLVRAYGKKRLFSLSKKPFRLRIKMRLLYGDDRNIPVWDKLLFALQKAGFLAEAPQFGMDRSSLSSVPRRERMN